MLPRRFESKVAVITGAAGGIGQACALRFAQEGAAVLCLDMADEANRATAQQCRAHGADAIACFCDVTQPDSVRSAVDTAMARWGRIDVLVAAAGISASTPLADITLESWHRLMAVNLTGVLLCNQAVAPILIRQRAGSIINLSSMAGKTSWPATAEYSASKSGVIGLTRSVAMELAPYGVTVNALCPGHVLTDMLRGIAAKIGPLEGITAEEWLQKRAADSPLKRMAQPEEMAGIAAFLASDDARYITGQALEADGGMVLS